MKNETRTVHSPLHAIGIGSAALALLVAGCRTADGGRAGWFGSAPSAGRAADVRGVRCLFDQKPWINADAAGDPDPEGIRYRAFLDNGNDKCALQKGTFHIELYQITRKENGERERTLVSDWNYPTSEFGTIGSKILGKGYHIQLRWAKKDIAGHEIELITQYTDSAGNVARSATKRLRVPKYQS